MFNKFNSSILVIYIFARMITSFTHTINCQHILVKYSTQLSPRLRRVLCCVLIISTFNTTTLSIFVITVINFIYLFLLKSKRINPGHSLYKGENIKLFQTEKIASFTLRYRNTTKSSIESGDRWNHIVDWNFNMYVQQGINI